MTERVAEVGWVLIPPQILAATDLNMAQKVLWGRINGLVGKNGYAWPSNNWLGGQLGMSGRTVERHIAILEQKGYLRRQVVRDDKGQVTERRLYPICREVTTGLSGGVSTELTGPLTTEQRGKSIRSKSIREESKNISDLNRQVDEIIDHLNEKTGSRFRYSEASRRPIRARLREGATVEDCKLIIDHKAAQWMGTEFEQYLNPETLFRPTKFERNLNAAIKWVEAGRPDIRRDFKSKLREDLEAAREFARAGNG